MIIPTNQSLGIILKLMEIMDFDQKWIMWIQVCLESSRASVLINGSCTKFFFFETSLRQGDPLSPFLFILAMKGLHVAMDNVVTWVIQMSRGGSFGVQYLSSLLCV